MKKNLEKQELTYIPDQQPREQHPDPDIAQNPDILARRSLPQVPEGQEIQPSKGYKNEIVGDDRHATTEIVTQAGVQKRVQTQKRPDLMSMITEASDQISVVPTNKAIQQERENGRVLFPSDFSQITVQEFKNTDVADLKTTYPQLRKRKLNRTHLSVCADADSTRVVKKK